MNLPQTQSDWLFLGILIGIGILLIIFLIWFNFFRKKRELLVMDREANEDTAFNALYQARSIVKMLKDKGSDTARAEKVLMEAERELKNGHYATVVALSTSAKSLAKDGVAQAGKQVMATKELVARPRGSAVKTNEQPRKIAAEDESAAKETTKDARAGFKSEIKAGSKMERKADIEFQYYKPTEAGLKPDKTEELLKETDSPRTEAPLPAESDSYKFKKKMPANFMESKFEIGCAEGAIDNAKKTGKDTAQADEYLSQAKSEFDTENYTSALSNALKVKKTLEGKKVAPETREVDRLPLKPKTTAPAPQAPTVTIRESARGPVSGAREAADASGISSDSCPSCSAQVTSDDNFCRKCGAKVESAMNCAKCGMELATDDMFCRKCGYRVGQGSGPAPEKHTYKCPTCQADIDPDAEECSRCGTKFD